MDENGVRALANRFFDALEDGDVDTAGACLTPEAVLWHNGTREAMSREENLEVLKGFVARSVSREYTDRRLDLLPDGFVHQHLLQAKAEDGYLLELAGCLVCRVANGRITRVDEYFDWTHLPEWFERTNEAFAQSGLPWPSVWLEKSETLGAMPSKGE